MSRKNKPQLVAKVQEETGVPAVDLDRLPVEALEQLDAIVPDTEEFPDEEEVVQSMNHAEVSMQPDEDHEAGSLAEVPADESDVRVGVASGYLPKVYLGLHPITLEKVYQ